MLLADEAFADEIRQHAARTDLDECARTRLPHRLNLFDKSHRLSDLVGEGGSHFLRVADVWLSCRVGVYGHILRAKRDTRKEFGERDRRRANDLGMECGSDIEAPRVHACRAKSLCNIGYRRVVA